MVHSRSKKISVMIFLLAIFIMLVVMTAGWIYKMYREQTSFTNTRTLATVECGKYYFDIDESTVSYQDGQLYFEIENTLGSKIETILVESGSSKVSVDIGLSQGAIYPVSIPINISTSLAVYPEGCKEVNFRNISFEPNV